MKESLLVNVPLFPPRTSRKPRSLAAIAFCGFLLLLSASVSLNAQSPRQILDASAEMYRKLQSFDSSGTFTTRLHRAGSDYDVTWPVSIAYADATMLPADSPVPVLSPLQRMGRPQVRDSDGQSASLAPGTLASPKGWSIFDRTNEGVLAVRRLPDEAVGVNGSAVSCIVLEVDYERGYPSRALSQHPIRYWIDPATHFVRRVSFSLQDADSDGSIRWTYTAESVRTNARPPRWALQALTQLAGEEIEEWIGREAPDFSLSNLQGRTVRLGDLRGKAVLLSFWATWCAPCKEELPLLERLRAEWAQKGVEVWGITNESAAKARGWLDEQGIEFPTLVDEQRLAFRSYEADQIPVSVVVDREGRVVSYLVGLAGEAHFREAIEKALAGSATGTP